MGVVAPTTGVLAAVIPVVVGFLTEGIPDRMVVVGIVVALVAVVLVTRAPGHVDDDRPSGIGWALLGGTMIGLFNVCVGQFSGDGRPRCRWSWCASCSRCSSSRRSCSSGSRGG